MKMLFGMLVKISVAAKNNDCENCADVSRLMLDKAHSLFLMFIASERKRRAFNTLFCDVVLFVE